MNRRNARNPAWRYGVATAMVLAIFCLLPQTVAGAGPSLPTVQVHGSVEVNRDPITLGDIATVSCEDPETARRLETVVVGKAPLAGSRRRLSLDYIQLRLKQSGVDPVGIRMAGPEILEVHRGSIHLPAEEIDLLVRDFLAAHSGADGDEVIITDIDVPREGVTLPKGDLDYDMDVLKQRRFSGSQPVYVDFRINGKSAKRVLVNVHMAIMRDVLVTRYPIARHRRISEADLVVRRMNIADLPGDLITDMNDAIGLQAKRPIGAQMPLRTGWLEQPILVEKGDRVLLVAEYGGLRVTALGEVRRKGRLGERISVINLDSNKAVYGRLVNARTVAVTF